jgi:predicted dehydrogenase
MILRLGLLSTARINGAVLGGAAATQAVDVVAVASRDHARAEAYAAEHGLARAHAGYDALLADPEVDAVYVPLPNSLHVEWAVRALEAGKHVLCEKPLTRHVAEAEAAAAAAARTGRVLAEGFMWRHHPQTRALEELLRAGTVGEVRLVRSAFTFALDRTEDVRLRPDLDGGALMDVGCYCVSALRLVAGEPLTVSGRQTVRDDGVDIRFTGTASFAGGVLGHFDCGMDVPARSGLEVVGSEGLLWVSDPWKGTGPGIEVHRPGAEVELVPVERTDPYRWELEEFAAAVRGDAPPRYGAADAVAQARVIAALYASADSGAEAAP